VKKNDKKDRVRPSMWRRRGSWLPTALKTAPRPGVELRIVFQQADRSVVLGDSTARRPSRSSSASPADKIIGERPFPYACRLGRFSSLAGEVGPAPLGWRCERGMSFGASFIHPLTRRASEGSARKARSTPAAPSLRVFGWLGLSAAKASVSLHKVVPGAIACRP